MPNSIIEAIKAGRRDFEPQAAEHGQFEATQALPGSGEKVAILAHRVEQGLPLWHPHDRRTADGREADR